jgi:hypothetical protein
MTNLQQCSANPKPIGQKIAKFFADAREACLPQ